MQTTPADAAKWADEQTPRYPHLHRVTLGDPVPDSVKYRDTYLQTTATFSEKPPFVAPPGCTGNCNHGRACDCLPDVPDDIGRSSRIPEGGGLVIAACLVGAIAACVSLWHVFARWVA